MQSVVTGRALSRSIPISSPHSSQIPYSPSFRRCSASWILKMSLRSRSRMRRIEFRFDSREARSVGSGKFPSSFMFSTVLPASKRSSLIRWFRRVRKNSRSLWFRQHLLRRRKFNGVHYRGKLTNINRESDARNLAADTLGESFCEGDRTGMRQNKNLRAFRQHGAVQSQLGLRNLLHRVMFFGKYRKKFGLPGNVVVHRDNDRRLDLIDHFDNVFESEIRHGVDGNHHDVDPLQELDLFRSQQMADVAQVGETQAPHLKNEDGIRDRPPALIALAGNIDNRDIFDGGPD